MRRELAKILAIGFLTTSALCLMQDNYENALRIKNETIEELTRSNDELYVMHKEKLAEIETLKSIDHSKYDKVRFTNYYNGDGSSGTRTGSGLTTADFKVNEKGFYTYGGKVVIATATWECINSEVGACKQYNSVPRGFEVYSYFDETEIIVDGITYQAIVLDSCGGSYWDEDLQRIDIFIANEEHAFGSKVGYIGG